MAQLISRMRAVGEELGGTVRWSQKRERLRGEITESSYQNGVQRVSEIVFGSV